MGKLILMFSLTVALCAGSASAQDDKLAQDRNAILNLAGCHKVEFHFAETFSPNPKYKAKPAYNEEALEWVGVIENSPRKISLQHILIVDEGMIIKHWREDWVYENTEFLNYDKNYTWKKVKSSPASVKGQWTQKVYQVDDGPRYEASGTWVHVDGRSEWQATTDSPLPRREHTKRSDYNVLNRTNRVTVTPTKWIHEEMNIKINRTSTGDSILTEEFGRNPYTKTSKDLCEVGEKWWNEQAEYWKHVRAAWDDVFASKQTITLSIGSGGEQLYSKLFKRGDEVTKSGVSDAAGLRKELAGIISSHLADGDKSSVK